MITAPRTLLELLAQHRGDSLAVLAPTRSSLSFNALLRQVERTLADLNRLGLGRGDVVALVLPQGPAIATAFLAVGSGAIAAPLNPAYTDNEFDFFLGNLDAKALIVTAGCTSPALAVAKRRGIPVLELVEVPTDPAGNFALRGEPAGAAKVSGPGEADDIALMLHTSGTTSRPKLVPLTQSNLVSAAFSIVRALSLGTNDRSLIVMPLFHIHSLGGGLLAPLAAGGSVAIPGGFDAVRFFAWMDELAPTWYTAAPTIHQAVLAQAPQFVATIKRRPLRFIRSASGPLPPSLMDELEARFGVPVIESYGMTEAAPQVTSNRLPPGIRKKGTVGVPAGPDVAIMGPDGVLLAQGEPGEVVVRGPNVLRGYANDPDANSTAFTAGWFRTGDVGYFDSDGYLAISGRIKEMINRGGEKVAPLEIDAVLLSHPSVAEALSFGIPHRTLGEEIAAAVVLRSGTQATESDIRNHAVKYLAPFKIPRKIVFLAAIPKSPTGKPQRLGLADRLGLTTKVTWTAPENAPQTVLEAAVAGLWCYVLNVERVGRNDDFFLSGGDSLQATQLILGIHDVFGVRLTADTLVGAAATVAGMANEITASRSALHYEVSRRASAHHTDEGIDVDFAEFEPPRSARDKLELFYVDPRTGLRRARPKTSYRGIVINKQGYRGPEIANQKPAGTARIAFLGSSSTFDTFVSNNNATWPHLTCANLMAAVPDANIDYVNSGLPGFNTRQLTVLFEEYLSGLDPDVAVIFVNDINADTAYLARAKGIYQGSHFQPSSWSKRHHKLWAIEKNGVIIARLLRAQFPQGKLIFTPVELSAGFEERLNHLVRKCQERCPVVALLTTAPRLRRSQSRFGRMQSAVTNVFYMPYMSLQGLLDAYDAYDDAIRRVGARTGALVIEAQGIVPGDSAHFIDSTHFRDAGSRRMAALVADSLMNYPPFRALVAD